MANNIDYIVSDFLLSPRKRIYRHLLLQLVVFLITINVFWDTPDELIITPARIRSWIGYFLLIDILIYVNAYVLVPRFLLKGRLLLYLIMVFALILVSIVTLGSLQTLFEDTRFEDLPSSQSVIWLNILSSTISSGLLVAGSSAMMLFKHWISNNQRVSELEATTLQSELKFLKSQINPHFLFNMLNNVYVLIRKGRDEAADVLFKLEDLLRYQFNDSAQDRIQLSSDIRFMSDFLNLEKIRRDKFNYTISKEGDINSVWLPPLLFIPFVENAVKHNTDGKNASFVYLSFNVQDNRLTFRCENSKPAEEEERDNRIGGLGLKNIRRRLDLLYPGRHSLEIIEDKQSYTVNLHLDL
ncbi:histidine kinase [uncultured Parabacteroides sp.]|jgi:two-component system LytT family sensor kinase|uniref:sensor histidine kinase n=1 Tax=uncultured Parabacteroides sp. TaxID=512312 RepID=UPI0025EA15AC|nr:histidine kinase [uncultured Parabacteroides sp.]